MENCEAFATMGPQKSPNSSSMSLLSGMGLKKTLLAGILVLLDG
jgi:hypothetical protein